MLARVSCQIKGRSQKMSPVKISERRQYPRINRQLPIKIAANGYNLSTSTQNVSCVGTYCHIDKYIPPFTRLMIKLALPIGGKKSNVECKGVIVRSEDEANGGFNIAIYFNGINENHKKTISRYVNQFLPQ